MTNLKQSDDRKTKVIRSSLSPKIRYNVLRRDGFTCQYCGRTAIERELEVDHIIPVSKGGTNDLENLQTSCIECNRGKLISEVVSSNTGIEVLDKLTYKELSIANQSLKILSVTSVHRTGVKGFGISLKKALVKKFGLKYGDTVVFYENDKKEIMVCKNGMHS